MTLSDKEMICCEYMNGMFVYPSKKVKEFIKELKEEFSMDVCWEHVCSKIDKLAGDKLI